MKRMITLGFTLAALAVAPGAQAAELTQKQVAKIAKRVFRAEIRSFEPAPGSDTSVEHAATANYSSTAGHAITAGHATTADRAAIADRATTADRSTTAEFAEVAGAAEKANPMAYALISINGQVDAQRSSGISQADVVEGHVSIGQTGLYCFFGPRPIAIQVTDVVIGIETPQAIGVGLGQPPPTGANCPAGTEFYVKTPGRTAFFVSLVL